MKCSVVKEFTFDAGHRVLGHGGKCKHLHGHTYKGLVEVSATRLNELYMVVDFYDLKQALSPCIAEWDHVMILSVADPLGRDLLALGQQVRLIEGNATVERMAHILFEKLTKALDSVCIVEKVVLWETPTSSAVVEREI